MSSKRHSSSSDPRGKRLRSGEDNVKDSHPLHPHSYSNSPPSRRSADDKYDRYSHPSALSKGIGGGSGSDLPQRHYSYESPSPHQQSQQNTTAQSSTPSTAAAAVQASSSKRSATPANAPVTSHPLFRAIDHITRAITLPISQNQKLQNLDDKIDRIEKTINLLQAVGPTEPNPSLELLKSRSFKFKRDKPAVIEETNRIMKQCTKVIDEVLAKHVSEVFHQSLSGDPVLQKDRPEKIKLFLSNLETRSDSLAGRIVEMSDANKMVMEATEKLVNMEFPPIDAVITERIQDLDRQLKVLENEAERMTASPPFVPKLREIVAAKTQALTLLGGRTVDDLEKVRQDNANVRERIREDLRKAKDALETLERDILLVGEEWFYKGWGLEKFVAVKREANGDVVKKEVIEVKPDPDPSVGTSTTSTDGSVLKKRGTPALIDLGNALVSNQNINKMFEDFVEKADTRLKMWVNAKLATVYYPLRDRCDVLVQTFDDIIAADVQ
ncbi:hypothetical protein HDU76_000787 [Blyttiomyces sp. JEL0837]|nr:hypothetical protein HDU76_000787 [Blyttiomyces sp. JEL0837]